MREEVVAAEAGRLDAEMSRATIRVARRYGSLIGGEGAMLAPDQLRGVLLHELGHALGVSGHARRGHTVMVREVAVVRRRGAALQRGDPLRDNVLAALYRAPNGLILSRHTVDAWRSHGVDRMSALARTHGLAGPFVRTGESRTRIYWSDAEGHEYGLVLVNLVETLEDPERALVAPEPRTRQTLPETGRTPRRPSDPRSSREAGPTG